MPIRELSLELVHDIVESYGQITKLNLSTNEISRVENLELLTRLTSLDLFCNRLGSVPGSLEGLSPLTRLKDLDVSENAITSLGPLSSAPVSLVRLNVANNSVSDVGQVSFLASLTALTELVLAGNPMTADVDYRRRTLTTLPSLTALDRTPRLDPRNPHDANADGEGLQTRPAQTLPAGAGAASSGNGLEPQAAAGPSLNTPPANSSCPPLDSAMPLSRTDASDPAPGSVGVEATPSQDVAVERQDRSESRSREPEESALAVPGSAGPAVSVSLPAQAVGWFRAEELSPLAAAGGGGVRGGEASVGESAASSAVSERSDEVPGGGRVFEAGSGAGFPSPRDGAASYPAAAPRAASDDTRAAPLRDGDSLLESSSTPPVEAAPAGLREKRSPATVPASAASRTATGAAFSAEAAAVDAPSSQGLFGAKDAVSLLLYNALRDAAASTLSEPATTTTATAATATKEETGSKARTHAVSSPFPLGGDHRGVEDDNAKEGVAESRASGGGLVPPAQLPLGGGGSWDSTIDGQRSKGQGFLHDKSAGGDGRAAHTPRVRAGSGRVEIESYRTSSSNGRQAVLPPPAAATAVATAAATATPSNTQGFQGGRDTATGFNRSSDMFSRRGSSFDRVADHDERPRPAYPTTGQHSGVGFARSTDGGGGIQDASLWSGNGGVDAPPDLPLHGGVPFEAGATGTSRGSQASRQAPGRVEGRRREGQGQAVMVDRREWEARMLENDDLRRQLALSGKRCAALVEMQRLADEALSSSHPPLLSSSSPSANPAAMVAVAATPRQRQRRRQQRQQRQKGRTGAFSLSPSSSSAEDEAGSERQSREQSGEEEGEETSTREQGQAASVAKLLATWRAEVLKLLLQRGADAEVAAAESREARRKVAEERDARGRAETEAKSLTQRALAAEAEAELFGIKLARAFEELREDRAGRSAAESSSSGYSVAVRGLHEWVHGFVGRASEGFFEREALLARGVAKLEAFSERLGLAAGRIEVLGTLLRRKEVQLRNSRAALAADRRVWLLERRDREIAALSKAPTLHRRSSDARAPRQSGAHHPGGDGGRGGGVLGPSPRIAAEGWKPESGDGGRGVADVGAAAAMQCPLLEGLRPECEAVMRALFCRVDRLGTGAVRARRLLEVLRSDCGVSEVMEAAVGKARWRAALDSMEAVLCPPLVVSGVAATTGAGANGSAGGGGSVDGGSRSTGESGAAAVPREERDVTWGEFLLFFLPSTGSADDAYNAGLVSHPVDGNGNGTSGWRPGYPAAAPAFVGTASVVGAGGARQRSNSFGAVSEDAAAMLQMVVPAHWTAGAVGAASGDGGGEAGESARRNGGGGGGGGGGAALGRGLAALSVGQLRREVLRLAKERAYLLELVREDGRLGRRRAEAVHDQYRHELRASHARIGELERLLEDSSRRAEAEHERGTALREEVSGLREEVAKAEQEWKRRLDAAAQEKSAALAESSREASKAATTARERISRLEAEHSLSLRENGKVSVRQRALERELARIKSSMHAEAVLEKEALEERLRAGEAKLATARRERNALLAALRDLQRRGRSGSDSISSLPPPTELGASRGGGGMTLDDLGEAQGAAGVAGGGDSRGRGQGAEKVAPIQTPSDGAKLDATAAQGSAPPETSSQGAAPEVVGSRGLEDLQAGGGEESDSGLECRGSVGERRDGAWQGAGVDGVDERGGSARAASLSARLEMLTVQTQQLLEDGSDTSYSSSSDGDSG